MGMLYKEITDAILGAFFDVYNALGYGFLESVWRKALARELVDRGHRVRQEAAVDVLYRDQIVGFLRADLIVDDLVVVELKGGPILDPFGQRQLYNYLRCSDLQVGLLLHFGPKPTFHRLVHTHARPSTINPP